MDLQSLLGYTLPVIQAPMAGVQGVELAVAVSEAGGLGSLPCAMMAADDLRKALRTITEQTNRPLTSTFSAIDCLYRTRRGKNTGGN